MSVSIIIINGPNFELLGKRQTNIYGYDTIQDINQKCVSIGEQHGLIVDSFQSNHEGEIIDTINQGRDKYAGIVINPGAYSHTSIAIMDALNGYDGKVIEVHISNLHKRETFRHHSYVSLRADGVIIGCGTQGYELAVLRLVQMLVQ